MTTSPFAMRPKAMRLHFARAVAATLIILLIPVVASPSANAQARTVETENTRHAGEFMVPVNKSQILRVDQPVSDLLVGNPEIADVLAISNRSVYVLGKQLGSTSLTIYGEGGRLIAVADLVVGLDIDGLKQRLFELLPEEEIEIRPINDSVVLSGTVSSASALDRALAVAERYAPGQVTNLMGVAGSQQVMLQVRFAEVSRSVTQELGLNTSLLDQDFPFALQTGGAIPGVSGSPELFNAFARQGLVGTALSGAETSATAFGSALTSGNIGSFTFDLLFDALERKGLVKTLAEPNLIALSGDTASFLAGGEFPVPVARDVDDGDTTITVEFKEFGVSLAFTPTVIDGSLINVMVEPEVSRIDPNNSFVNQGFVIPGLTTRRASTTVELRDGQAFAIAGLIQSDFNDTIRQLPGLGEVPIIGALARSTEFQRNETELVIIVTPRLVKPAPAGSLVTPADGFVPPSTTDMLLFGRTEAPSSGKSLDTANALGASNAGGLGGTYGHIVK